jgi:KipI family sensor histidine kinase inhibitor
MRVLPSGDRATLLEFADLTEATRWYLTLRDHADVTLGARTVLVRQPCAETQRLIATNEPQELDLSDVPTVEIPTLYDGPDLAAVAASTGLSEADVIAAHTGTPWRVAFAGFAPGFAYLVDGDPRLVVARLDRPRPHVHAGAVGLAGPFSGIYPRASPGGWQLIGTTDAPLWDLARDEPALLRPGTLVTFTRVEPA